MSKSIALFVSIVFFLFTRCTVKPSQQASPKSVDWKTKNIPENPQFPKGDKDRGFTYMKSGAYIGSGVPWEMVKKKLATKNPLPTNREVAPGYYMDYKTSLFKAPNGEMVVSGNCFTCHATTFNGSLAYGIGDTFYDYTKSQTTPARILKKLVHIKYKKESPERKAFEDFGNYYNALAPKIVVPVIGVNPAFRLAEACIQYRNPVDLTYQEEKRFSTMRYTIATDVPPLWNVRKKNALYYNGMGRGNFTKLLMQSVLLGLPDTLMARKVQQEFNHVLTWLNELEPPKYPKDYNEVLVKEGKSIFSDNCESCHGTYGRFESYPNKVVALQEIKTDPWYAWYAQKEPGFSDWYNQSWFALSEPTSNNAPLSGYIAPPLDGIWATAPYLHNGSIPTLMTLLNSKIRPKFWQRSGKTDDYDFENVGWNFKDRNNAGGKYTYDTTQPGYSNSGHFYGDKLSEQDRIALIEYLKTL